MCLDKTSLCETRQLRKITFEWLSFLSFSLSFFRVLDRQSSSRRKRIPSFEVSTDADVAFSSEGKAKALAEIREMDEYQRHEEALSEHPKHSVMFTDHLWSRRNPNLQSERETLHARAFAGWRDADGGRDEETVQLTLSCFFFFFDSRFDERRSLKLPPIGFVIYRERKLSSTCPCSAVQLPLVVSRFVRQIDLRVDLYPNRVAPTTVVRPFRVFFLLKRRRWSSEFVQFVLSPPLGWTS